MMNGNSVMSEKFFVFKMFMLFLAGAAALIVIQRYYPLFIRPMVISLAATLAFAGFRRESAKSEHHFSKMVTALEASAQAMSAEIQKVREELRHQREEEQGTKTAGFQGPGNGKK
jgi:hypothetical protein